VSLRRPIPEPEEIPPFADGVEDGDSDAPADETISDLEPVEFHEIKHLAGERIFGEGSKYRR
jgi:hypothetical protein